MRAIHRTLLTAVSILFTACVGGGKDQQIAQDEAQSIVDSAAAEGVATIDYIDQFEAADITGQAAISADTIAENLAIRINANHAKCATAIATANVVTTNWDCTVGEGDQAVTINGTTTINVTVNGQTVTFDGSTTGLTANEVTVDSATQFVVDLQATTATITRNVSLAKGDDILTIDLDGTAVFDNSGQGSRKVTVNATREVQLNNLSRTQTWQDVVYEEGKRLPISGTISVDGAARDVTAVFSQDAEGVVTIEVDVIVTNQQGEVVRTSSFVFIVDTANGDAVVPE